jgi:hypothetical protein
VNRWFRVAGGVGLNLCLGAAYVYSVFLTPLQDEFGWTRSELSAAFTLSIAFIAAGVLIGGRWQDRRGPAAVSLAGALLFSAGIFLSRYTDSLAWLYGCYGVVVGLGSGIGYTCPLSVGMKWFPERRGLVTGVRDGKRGARTACPGDPSNTGSDESHRKDEARGTRDEGDDRGAVIAGGGPAGKAEERKEWREGGRGTGTAR